MSTTVDPVRRVLPADVPRICQLVGNLAEYERAPDEAQMTDEQLHEALFGDGSSLYGQVAEVDGMVVGFALWFRNFSTWRGRHGIYLEDLFVEPEHRGLGIGKALLAALARECVTNGYPRLEWWVLNWNEPKFIPIRAPTMPSTSSPHTQACPDGRLTAGSPRSSEHSPSRRSVLTREPDSPMPVVEPAT